MRISVGSSDVCSSDLLRLKGKPLCEIVFIASEFGIDLRKSITEKTRRFRHGRDGVFDLLGVVPFPFLHWDKTAQRIGLQIANIALYGDIAEFETIALFHHIGADEVPLVRRQFSNRGNDAKIGITLREIESPQLVLVISQTTGLIAGALTKQ